MDHKSSSFTLSWHSFNLGLEFFIMVFRLIGQIMCNSIDQFVIIVKCIPLGIPQLFDVLPADNFVLCMILLQFINLVLFSLATYLAKSFRLPVSDIRGSTENGVTTFIDLKDPKGFFTTFLDFSKFKLHCLHFEGLVNVTHNGISYLGIRYIMSNQLFLNPEITPDRFFLFFYTPGWYIFSSLRNPQTLHCQNWMDPGIISDLKFQNAAVVRDPYTSN